MKTQTVADLKPADYNPRKISKAQLDALGHAMKEFGDLGGVVVNVRTGNLIGGHQRVRNLDPKWAVVRTSCSDKTGTISRGHINTPWGLFDYREVDWSLTKEKAANLAANQHGGAFDMEGVSAILGELAALKFDLDLTGFLPDHELRLPGQPSVVEDEPPARPKTPTTRLGEVIALGRHRVICGDATIAAHWSSLLWHADGKADCMWTDPPYGVEYVGKTKRKLEIEGDKAQGLREMLVKTFLNATTFALEAGAAIYVAHPAGALSITFSAAFLNAGWRLHETLVWLKNSMVLGHSDYHYRHEPILYGYVPGGGRRGRGALGWYGPNNETSVLAFDRPSRSEDHPTMKPVALVAHCLKNSCKPDGGKVIDPFLGSGTTLIAAEQTGRTCYGMEIDPCYVDVIVERWEKLTGKKSKSIIPKT